MLYVFEALLAVLRNVQQFLDRNKEALAGLDLGALRASLDDVVLQFTTQAVDQNAGRVHGKSETARLAQLRADLRIGQLKPIAEVAKATLRELPELKPFSLPSDKTSSVRLVALAGAIADQAKKHEQTFIAGGLPHDFLAQLTAAAAALTESLGSRSEGTTRSRGATHALSPLAKRGRGLLRILHSLITPKLRLNDRLLGEWKAVKTVPRKPGPARATAASVPVVAGTPVTATSPAVPGTPAPPTPAAS